MQSSRTVSWTVSRAARAISSAVQHRSVLSVVRQSSIVDLRLSSRYHHRLFTTTQSTKMPTTTIRQREIFYTVTTPSAPRDASSSAQTIIFIHGLGSTSSFFQPILPYLTSQGHTCIIFDNYGAGLSPLLSSHPQTSIDDIAADALSLLDTHHVSRAIIVGYSMGALAALSLAATNPTRTTAIICLGPVNPSNTDGLTSLKSRITTLETCGLETLASQISSTAPSPSSLSSPLIRPFIFTLVVSSSRPGYIANLHAILAAPEPKYEKIRAPVYILVGEDDRSCPPRYAQQMYMNLGNSAFAKFDTVEECGHWYCIEKPDVVGELVGEFVKAVT